MSELNQNQSVTHCGFVAVVGRPNVGKSTLMNALIGAKLSIVSNKAQTTRHRIHGVLTEGAYQYVFVDTPGFQTRHSGEMNRMMNRVVVQTLQDVDVVLHVVQADKFNEGDQQVIPLLPDAKKCILVVNKIDLIKDKTKLYAFVSKLMEAFPYEAVVPVSAFKRRHLEGVLKEISARLPESEPMFEEEALTDRSMRFVASEIIREKIFRLVGDELPYGCTVQIEDWIEEDKGVHIQACVIVEKEGHRPILLGEKGLHKGWTDKQALLKELGYE